MLGLNVSSVNPRNKTLPKMAYPGKGTMKRPSRKAIRIPFVLKIKKNCTLQSTRKMTAAMKMDTRWNFASRMYATSLEKSRAGGSIHNAAATRLRRAYAIPIVNAVASVPYTTYDTSAGLSKKKLSHDDNPSLIECQGQIHSSQ